jgi:hypothetical protein
MKNKNLEGKLRAIQDLKAERYIGTQEAWDYLCTLEYLLYLPKQVSEEVNMKLKNKLQRGPNFPATADKIIGTYMLFQDIFDRIFQLESEEIEKENNNIRRDDYNIEDEYVSLGILSDDDFPLRKTDLLFDYLIVERERLVEHIYPLFEMVQKPKTTITEFAINAIKLAKSKCSFAYPSEVNDFFDIYLSNNSFMDNFSKDSIRDYYSGCHDVSFGKLDLLNRWNRIKRDQIDHMLERRREIISDFISNESYNLEMSMLRAMIEENQKRLNDLQELNAPASIIKNDKMYLEYKKDILKLLDSEKNFVTRILKS